MTRTPRRSAFTLIELMVVIVIMLVILALGTAVAYSGAFDSQKIISASDRSSGWLLIAKNRAKRDGAPRGVRFLRNAAGQVTEALYIEAPEQWVPNPDQELNPHGPRIITSYQFATTPPTDVKYVYYVSYNPTLPAGPQPAGQADILAATLLTVGGTGG